MQMIFFFFTRCDSRTSCSWGRLPTRWQRLAAALSLPLGSLSKAFLSPASSSTSCSWYCEDKAGSGEGDGSRQGYLGSGCGHTLLVSHLDCHLLNETRDWKGEGIRRGMGQE